MCAENAKKQRCFYEILLPEWEKRSVFSSANSLFIEKKTSQSAHKQGTLRFLYKQPKAYSQPTKAGVWTD
jgi:hypothetical protein